MKPARAGIIGLAAIAMAAQVWSAREDGLTGAFLDTGVGGRPLAMGRAFTGVADDIDSLYYNPAGLGTYRSSQVEFQYSPLEGGGSSGWAAYSQPLYGRGNLGFGIVNLMSGSIDKTENVGGEPISVGSFSNRQTGYLLGYGQKVASKFALGSTLKMAENSIDGKSARGFGLDAGGLWLPNDRARVGVTLMNLLPPTYSFDTEKERFPTILRAGGSLEMLGGHLRGALDLEKTIGISQNPKWHWGVEGFVLPSVVLRAGYDAAEITGGVGIRWQSLALDYAMGFQDLGLTNKVSLKAYFGGYEVDIKANPSVFSPVGLKNKTTFKISAMNRRRIVKWILSIRNTQGDVVRSFQGFNAPPTKLEWDGRDAQGQLTPPGTYTYRLAATDAKQRTEMTPLRSLEIRSPSPLEIEAR